MKKNKSTRAPRWLRYGSYALSALFLPSLLAFLLTERETILVVTIITIPATFLAVGLLVTEHPLKLTHVRFEGTAILICLGKLVLKRIPYERVQGATIECAVSQPFRYPYLDREGKARAVLTLCRSEISSSSDIKSDSVINWFDHRHDALCCDLCYEKHLKILLDKTPIKVYITESMLTLHNDLLYDALQAYPERFVVACFDKTTQKEQHMPYPEYLLRHPTSHAEPPRARIERLPPVKPFDQEYK